MGTKAPAPGVRSEVDCSEVALVDSSKGTKVSGVRSKVDCSEFASEGVKGPGVMAGLDCCVVGVVASEGTMARAPGVSMATSLTMLMVWVPWTGLVWQLKSFLA